MREGCLLLAYTFLFRFQFYFARFLSLPPMLMDPHSEDENRRPRKPAATDDADARFPIGQVTTLGEKEGITSRITTALLIHGE